MPRSRNSLTDAQAKYFISKFPHSDTKWGFLQQLYPPSNNQVLDGTTGLISGDMGHPYTVNVYIQAPSSNTATFTIQLSNDGENWFTYGTGIALNSSYAYTNSIVGASFVKITSSSAINPETYVIQVVPNY